MANIFSKAASIKTSIEKLKTEKYDYYYPISN